jgi:hypothetical protein
MPYTLLVSSSIMLSVERDGMSRPLDVEEEPARGQWTFMDEPVTVSLHWTMLHIRAPLTAGDTLVLRYATDYDETEGRELADAGLREVEVRWPVVEEQELPSTLGALEVRKQHGAARPGSGRAHRCLAQSDHPQIVRGFRRRPPCPARPRWTCHRG